MIILGKAVRAVILAGVASGAVAAAHAQEGAPAGTESAAASDDGSEIVVTARRREETLINVPIAITAFTARAGSTPRSPRTARAAIAHGSRFGLESSAVYDGYGARCAEFLGLAGGDAHGW